MEGGTITELFGRVCNALDSDEWYVFVAATKGSSRQLIDMIEHEYYNPDSTESKNDFGLGTS